MKMFITNQWHKMVCRINQCERLEPCWFTYAYIGQIHSYLPQQSWWCDLRIAAPFGVWKEYEPKFKERIVQNESDEIFLGSPRCERKSSAACKDHVNTRTYCQLYLRFVDDVLPFRYNSGSLWLTLSLEMAQGRGVKFYPSNSVVTTQPRFLAALNIFLVITAKNVERWASPNSPSVQAIE